MSFSPAVAEAFQAFKGDLVASLDQVIVKWPTPPLSTHFQELIDFATSESPPLTGLIAAQSFLALTGADPSSPAASPAYALGWIAQLLHISTAIIQDLADKAQLRQGRRCWNRDIGYASISDAYFLENVVHVLVLKYFPDTGVRRGLKQLIERGTLLATLCQVPIAPDRDADPFAVWLPVAAALCAAPASPPDAWRSEALRALLFDASKLLKVAREFADFRAAGEAIVNGARTWLFEKALETAGEEQKAVLRESNGKSDGVEAVREIYRNLGVDALCTQFLDAFASDLKARLDELKEILPEAVADIVLSALSRT
jgi:hypothetical protein